MNMKLRQRLLIRYYKTKLKALALLSPDKAAEAAWQLFCTPFPSRLPKKIPPVFLKAEKLSFEKEGITLRGFRWQPEHPNGKKILIIHGFSSYAYKFEKYITPLKKEGFEVLAFDAPAHGMSGGKIINAYLYSQTLLSIEFLFGPIYGFLGHSLGGLAASLAFEQLPENLHRKLVLVAPATETKRAIDNFFTLLSVEQATREAFISLISKRTLQPISYYSVGRVVKNIQSPVLWVHDQQDNVCSFEDVRPLLSEDLPHVQFRITEQLGHNKVYREQSVCDEIIHFFTVPVS